MKIVMYFLLILPTSLFAGNQDVNSTVICLNPYQAKQAKKISKPDTCLTPTDAEKILGLTAIRTEHSSEQKDGITKYRCTYTATAKDPATGKASNVYFLLEAYKNADASKKAYFDILGKNENMPGIKILSGIGDQAYLHTDNENFVMIIARQGHSMLRLKVNALTGTTSLNELQHIAERITAAL